MVKVCSTRSVNKELAVFDQTLTLSIDFSCRVDTYQVVETAASNCKKTDSEMDQVNESENLIFSCRIYSDKLIIFCGK